MTELDFPGPEPGDPEDVAWTLQTAGTMWARGDHHDAVRWLRRAAEAASDSGADMRAVALAKAAADLTGALQLPPSVTPPPVAAPHEPAPSRPQHPAILPMDDADQPHDGERTVPDLKALEARSSPQAAPPPPPRRSSPAAAPSAPLPPPRSRPSSPAPARSSPSVPPARSSPSVPPPRSSPSGAPALRSRQALRVAVEVSADDRGLLLVRPLTEGQPVPDGQHEAILTALEPGAHLLSKKR